MPRMTKLSLETAVDTTVPDDVSFILADSTDELMAVDPTEGVAEAWATARPDLNTGVVVMHCRDINCKERGSVCARASRHTSAVNT